MPPDASDLEVIAGTKIGEFAPLQLGESGVWDGSGCKVLDMCGTKSGGAELVSTCQGCSRVDETVDLCTDVASFGLKSQI